ncbi:MAG: hypothetical protein OQK00_10605 [Rhodobacteraceae bacterium]|nr:hypothetical protein [Paracoccaceae bacterium]MCW9041989.1 hypothetical protein [Pseudopelagicola sp.]
MRPVFLFSFFLALTAGCAQFPNVNSATDPALADAPYPALLPVEEVLDQDEPRLDENSEAALQGRINRLKHRAATLQSAESE